METYYRLESSMGGYLRAEKTLKAARKTAIKLSNEYGYPVKIFKAKRDALRETRGELLHTIKSKASNPSVPKNKWIKAKAVKFCSDGRVQVKR